MKRYLDTEIQKAKELRQKEGYSFAELQKQTGIPATTIRNWCRHDGVTNRWATLLLSNEKKRQLIKTSEQDFVSISEFTTQQAKVYASLLYWCEGYKYPASNRMGFTNSDPNLQKTFITLLRKGFPIDEKKLLVHLQLHTTHDEQQMQRFWSDLLAVPVEQFMKSTITEKRGGKHRPEYFGTCTLRYHDFRLQLKLIGIYEAFMKQLGEIA